MMERVMMSRKDMNKERQGQMRNEDMKIGIVGMDEKGGYIERGMVGGG